MGDDSESEGAEGAEEEASGSEYAASSMDEDEASSDEEDASLADEEESEDDQEDSPPPKVCVWCAARNACLCMCLLRWHHPASRLLRSPHLPCPFNHCCYCCCCCRRCCCRARRHAVALPHASPLPRMRRGRGRPHPWRCPLAAWG